MQSAGFGSPWNTAILVVGLIKGSPGVSKFLMPLLSLIYMRFAAHFPFVALYPFVRPIVKVLFDRVIDPILIAMKLSYYIFRIFN